ncbi:Kunitz-type trypsin inhibitor-like 2 protein, partial [Mucuna pruriens]
INGIPVEFNIPGVNPGVIFTGVTPLDIEFTKKPNCAENSQWSLFEDNKIEETYVGIGGPGNHPGQQMLSGMFRIQKYGPQKYNSYKLVFCPDASSTCSNIGRYDNEEGGRRLVLTQDRPYEVIFVNAYNRDATIKSVSNGTLIWFVELRRDERLGEWES